jgi:hypothetical protein
MFRVFVIDGVWLLVCVSLKMRVYETEVLRLLPASQPAHLYTVVQG